MTANKWLLSLMVPAALAVGLGACNQPGGATQPGSSGLQMSQGAPQGWPRQGSY